VDAYYHEKRDPESRANRLAITRSATHFLALESILKHQDDL